MIVAILMGRKDSSGFPGKNFYPVLGRPLVTYPLIAASESVLVDKIYISTDSAELSRIAEGFGARTLWRPAELCSNEALGEHVYEHALGAIRADLGADGESIEQCVLLMANAAMVTASTIDEGVRVLRERPELDSAVTVSRYNMWSPLRARQKTESGLLEPFVPFETFGDPATMNCDRDSQGDVWFADMGVSIVRPMNLDNLAGGLLPQKWMGRRIYPLEQWGGLDVDYEWQIPLVEYWLRAHGTVPA